MYVKGLCLILFILALPAMGIAQPIERCGTTKYETLQLQLNPNRERSPQFEIANAARNLKTGSCKNSP